MISFNEVYNYVNQHGHCWFIESKKRWNCTLTLGGVDVNASGDDDNEAKTNLVNRLIGSSFFNKVLERKCQERHKK